MGPLITTAAMAALKELGPHPSKIEIARAIAVIVDAELGTVIVTPDEALDHGDLIALQARRNVIEKLDPDPKG